MWGNAKGRKREGRKEKEKRKKKYKFSPLPPIRALLERQRFVEKFLVKLSQDMLC